jgi:diguanylate cyclase (GGDEF)-like protein/PAS domain S-box-containing protein
MFLSGSLLPGVDCNKKVAKCFIIIYNYFHIMEKTDFLNQDLLRSVLDAIPSILFVVDADVRILHMNAAAAQLVGGNGTSAHLKRGGEALHCIRAADTPEGCGRGPACQTCIIRTSVNKARQGTAVFREPVSMTLVDHQGYPLTVHLQVTASPFRDSDGSVLLILENMTELRLALEKAQASEHRYKAIVEHQAEFVCRYLPGGIVTFVNDTLCRYVQMRSEDLLGKSFFPFIHHEDRDAFIRQIEALDRDNPSVVAEARVRMPDGRTAWHRWTHHALFGVEGRLVEYQCTGSDVTDRRLAEERLRESEARYRLLYDQSPDGILLIDTSGAIVEFNESAHYQLGYSREDFAGLTIADINPFETSEQIAENMRRILQEGKTEFETRHRTKSGEIRNVLVISQAITISGATVYHSIWRDITERKRIEEALKESEEKFRTLFESASDALFIIDVQGNFLDVNTTAHRRLGYTKEEMLALPLSRLDHPSYAPLIRERFRELTELGQSVFESAHVRKDGTVMPVEVNTRLIELKGQKVAFSVARDITGRKRTEDALRESEAKLRNITSVIGEGIYALDAQARLTFMNPEAEKLLGWTEAELFGRQVHDIIHFQKADGKPCTHGECPALRTITTGEIYRNEEDVFTRKDGSQFPASSVCTPLREDGEIVGSVTVFQDITERKRAAVELKLLNEILAQQATSDPLTGIANRLKFNDRLSNEIQRSKRFGTPLSLMMFDIDHFKRVNDTHGHLTGDAVLRELTSLVGRYVRMHDIFARWGGEEFMIMLVNTTAENARLFAEKLRSTIASSKFYTVGQITCSFGVAQLKLEDTDDRFTHRVDEALYQAKVKGRNRVEIA